MFSFYDVKQARISLLATVEVLSSSKRKISSFSSRSAIETTYFLLIYNAQIFVKPNALKTTLELNALISRALSHVTSCELTNDEVEFTTNLFRMTSLACHIHQMNFNHARLCCCLGYMLVIYTFYVIGLYQIIIWLY